MALGKVTSTASLTAAPRSTQRATLMAGGVLPRLLRCSLAHGGSPAPLATHLFFEQAATPCSTSTCLFQPSPGRHFSSSPSSYAAAPSNTPGPMEVLGMLFSPAQLGASTLELTHSASGLPWWASIPTTAVAARLALLPLSIKARQASANLPLLNKAFQQAKLLTLDMSPSDSRALGRLALVRTMYRHLQARHNLPSMRWYWANAVAQTVTFTTFTSALSAMSSALWPGLPTGGPPGLRDLTSPPVYLTTLSTPFGTMGAVMPLAIVLTYVRTVDMSPTARVPGIGVALRLMAIPCYCLALIQPHASLLYWLSHALTVAAVQALPLAASSSQPALATAAAAAAAGEQQAGGPQGLDVDLLVALGGHYSALPVSKQSCTAAVLCYGRALRELRAQAAAAAGAGESQAEASKGAAGEGAGGGVAGQGSGTAVEPIEAGPDQASAVGGEKERLLSVEAMLATAQQALNDFQETSKK